MEFSRTLQLSVLPFISRCRHGNACTTLSSTSVYLHTPVRTAVVDSNGGVQCVVCVCMMVTAVLYSCLYCCCITIVVQRFKHLAVTLSWVIVQSGFYYWLNILCQKNDVALLLITLFYTVMVCWSASKLWHTFHPSALSPFFLFPSPSVSNFPAPTNKCGFVLCTRFLKRCL